MLRTPAISSRFGRGGGKSSEQFKKHTSFSENDQKKITKWLIITVFKKLA